MSNEQDKVNQTTVSSDSTESAKGYSGSMREQTGHQSEQNVKHVARSTNENNAENTFDLIEPWEFSI